MADVDVQMSGPLFNGQAARAAHAACDAIENDIAEAGADLARGATAVFRNPTGRYRSRIRTDRAHGDAVVTDTGIVYGPWLEGDSERNRRSSFKGYRIWRLTGQRLQARAKPIAERAMPALARRMGG